MKSLILIAVLAALTVCNDAASIPEEVAQDEEVGYVYRKGDIRLGDVLLFRKEARVAPEPDTVHYMSFEYNSTTTRVTGLSILEPGLPQGGRSTVTGFGTYHVTVTLISGLGKGFFYIVEMWGRNN